MRTGLHTNLKTDCTNLVGKGSFRSLRAQNLLELMSFTSQALPSAPAITGQQQTREYSLISGRLGS